MALAKETTTLTIASNGTNHIGDYVLIYGVSFDASSKPAYSETKYFVWWGVSDATAPSVSNATGVHVVIAGGDTSSEVAKLHQALLILWTILVLLLMGL